MPESVLERAPSAELRPGQLDQDSLPPYEMLDRILTAYVEEDRGRDELVSDGLPPDGRRRGDRDGRPLRVQAPPGTPRDQDHPEGVRARPPAADHEPVPRLIKRRKPRLRLRFRRVGASLTRQVHTLLPRLVASRADPPRSSAPGRRGGPHRRRSRRPRSRSCGRGAERGRRRSRGPR